MKKKNGFVCFKTHNRCKQKWMNCLIEVHIVYFNHEQIVNSMKHMFVFLNFLNVYAFKIAPMMPSS